MHNLIAVANHSALSDVVVKAYADAARKQAWYHAAPMWGLARIPVLFYPDPLDTPEGSWVIGVFDHADQAGALGYHDRTPTGLPYGRVFVQPSRDEGVTVSSVLSHEVLEAVGDPIANTWREDGAGHEYAQELCDPCQGDTYNDQHAIEVSDFVLPPWFIPGASGPYTYRQSLGFLSKIDGPFVIAPGGYAIIRKATPATYVRGTAYPEWRSDRLGEPGSRTALRT